MPAAAIPAWALVTAAVAPAAAQAATGIYGARKQGSANDKALAFNREQAQTAAQSAEADRHANYDQWAVQQRHQNAVRKAMGWGVVDVPDYVPGATPQFVPRSVGDYLSGPQPTAPRPPARGAMARQPAFGTPRPYRAGDVNSYL